MTTATLSPPEHAVTVSTIVGDDGLVVFVPTLEPISELHQANMIPVASAAPGAARISVASLESEYPDLKQVGVQDVKQDSGKVTLSRIVLRAFVARALSGSNVDLSTKSLKGAFLTNAANSRLTNICPAANAWKGKDRSEILELLPEMASIIHAAILGTVATKTVTSELEKARKYISGLSPETLMTLRNEGII